MPKSRTSGRRKHGGWCEFRTTYKSWESMKRRCSDKGPMFLKNYGARGIVVCERWANNFAAFFEDMGERPAGHSLDRINNDGNYEPSNCRWATMAQQRRNSRQNTFIEHDGKRMVLEDWAKTVGLNPATLSTRLRRGWPVSRALAEMPIFKRAPAHPSRSGGEG